MFACLYIYIYFYNIIWAIYINVCIYKSEFFIYLKIAPSVFHWILMITPNVYDDIIIKAQIKGSVTFVLKVHTSTFMFRFRGKLLYLKKKKPELKILDKS